MSEKISILKLMTKDHSKIDGLIDELDKKSNDDYSKMIKAFHNFEWELEKHIFTEEKAIFTDYNPENVSEGYKMLPELTKQHNYIVNTLNSWRMDIRNKKTPRDIYSFKEFLRKHRDFEEKELYPKLDEELDEQEKKNIVAKINEIIQK
jgi:hemerythrin-like domain-containing protein